MSDVYGAGGPPAAMPNDPTDPTQTNPNLQDALRLGGVDPTNTVAPKDTGPKYRIMADSKIPIAKSYGSLWKARIDQACGSRKDAEICWNEAIRYYENDQLSHRRDANRNDHSGNTRGARTLGTNWIETENVVFSNAATMLPMLYSKNPAIEVTEANEANEKFADAVEDVINALFTMDETPGIALKNKVRRGILTALLTNNAYLKLGWVQKENSTQQALTELQQLSTELREAESQKDITDLEGKIEGLLDKVSLLEPAGPTTQLVSPFRIYVDPTAREPSHSDANWIAEFDFLPTPYINAVYGKPKGPDSEQIVSVYEPTHVLTANSNADAIEDEVASFSLIHQPLDMNMSTYGYKTQEAFKNAQYTKVWWVWDKTTRRVFLYADNAWDWPLWVWDDPLQLLCFYPYFRLWFHETPEGAQPKGEVTYYLDQQDAINEVNDEIARARKWVKRNIFYNKNAISQEDVEAVLKGPDNTARGLDLQEGQKMNDAIFSVQPPALAYPQLFDNTKRFETINRITGIGDAQKGGEYKTNTTNEAVQSYQQQADIRVDEKIDAIEDWIGRFGWALAQLCLRYWTSDDVADLIGADDAKNWQQVNDPSQLRNKLNFRVVGGSTDKPNSKNKKQEALQMGQVLGQFANSIPAAGMVLLKVFERAFDEVVISDDDWEVLLQSMQAQQNKAGAGPNGQPGGPPQPGAPGQPPQQPPQEQQPEPVPPPPQNEAGGHDVSPAQAQMIREQIAKLPPDLKAHMAELVGRGVQPSTALAEVTKPTPAPRFAPPPPVMNGRKPPSRSLRPQPPR